MAPPASEFFPPMDSHQGTATPWSRAWDSAYSDADDALRSQLEIPAGTGVVVTGVKAGSVAEKAGLKKNDMILALGDQKAGRVTQVRKDLLKVGKEPGRSQPDPRGEAGPGEPGGPRSGVPGRVAEYWVGVPVSPVDATLRAHLPACPPTRPGRQRRGQGQPRRAGRVRKNDILVAMDGKPLKASEDLIAQIQASQGKPVPLTVLRAGKPMTITITPAKRTDWSLISSHHANLDGRPRGPIRYQFVRPNMAIEMPPQAGRDPARLRPGRFSKAL